MSSLIKSMILKLQENIEAYHIIWYMTDLSLMFLYDTLQVNLIITLSLGSIGADGVISEPCYNEVTYYRHSKIINLGAMAWPCYIENCIIMRCVIMRLNCTNSSTSLNLKFQSYIHLL